MAAGLLTMAPVCAQDEPAAATTRMAPAERLINNLFVDTDLRQALSDIAIGAGVTIVADESVRGFISMELKDVPLSRALDLLLLAGGYVWAEVQPGVFLVAEPNPDSPAFIQIAQTSIVPLQYATTDMILQVLPEVFVRFLRMDTIANRVVITAPQSISERIAQQIALLDVPSAATKPAVTSPVTTTVWLRNTTLKAVLSQLPTDVGRYITGDPQAKSLQITAPADIVNALLDRIAALDALPVEVRLQTLAHLTGDGLLSLLPSSMAPYVAANAASKQIVVEAPRDQIDSVVEMIERLDAAAANDQPVAIDLRLSYLDSGGLQALLPDDFKANVRVDADGNRAVILAESTMAARIADYIQSVDVAPPQIMIEALVVETDAGALDRFRASAQSENIGFDGAAGTISFIKDPANILYQITSLVSQNQAKVKASPRVVAQEGKEANVRVATEQYFRIVTARQNYDYVELQAIESGIGLTITPRVAEKDGMVTCEISPEVGDVTATSADNLPVITKRTATTTVRVRDGEVIAIGGLLEEMERRTTSKIPILGDLPLVGELFKTHNTEISKREVTIFIVPHILDDHGEFEGGLIFEGMSPSTTPGSSTSAPEDRRVEQPAKAETFRLRH